MREAPVYGLSQPAARPIWSVRQGRVARLSELLTNYTVDKAARLSVGADRSWWIAIKVLTHIATMPNGFELGQQPQDQEVGVTR